MKALLSNKLQELDSHFTRIDALTPIYGGSINTCYKLRTNHNAYFLKTNTNKPSDFFEKEALGLAKISSTKTINCPTVVTQFNHGENSYLLIEYISQNNQPTQDQDWYLFGKQLAELHLSTSENFGLEHDNYIGALQQVNTPSSLWSEFYIQHRLEHQFRLAIDSNLLSKDYIKKFNSIFSLLEDFYPVEKPSLLHGDLWSGNMFFSEHKTPYLFDPACYYGHREIDLGMTLLFGGFSTSFIQEYHNTYKLENHWEERVSMSQLYPILVHINLFGLSYLPDLNNIIKRYL